MSLSLVINNNNVVKNGLNSQYTYTFIQGGLRIPENSEICISNCTIPYAFYNINQQLYNNASFSYTFPTSSGTQNYNVTLPNGFYSTADINQYLQTVMIQNNQYLVNADGNYIYYITLADDSTYYGVELDCYAIPSTLPSGWSNPVNMYLPTTATTPQLVISGNNFGALIGYTEGSYPPTPQNTNYDTLSNTTPNASPVNSLIMRCNLVDNNVVMPSDILDSIPINATFGSNITYQPTFAKWIKLKAGLYNSITLTIYDQNLNIIQSQDPNLAITLMIKLGNSNVNIGK